ncbi:MAG: hydrogenase expression/formation protein HypE [Thermoplasmata archaeon]
MKRITLAHGAGGETMQRLIGEHILKNFGGIKNKKIGVPLDALDDSAVIDDIVFTTDGHTVKPIFFPGGDIGVLSVAGTINDIAVMGANPLALSAAFIIEEGFSIDDYARIVNSMRKTSRYADVPIITGDTKVVEKGAAEKIFITTSGVGKKHESLEHNMREVKKYRKFNEKWLLDSNLGDGDKIIVSGNIGEHGVAILSFREGYGFESKIKSDVAPLNKMIAKILKVGGIVAMKDPTRGGVANTLNEWSQKSGVGISIMEEEIPISEAVLSACEMLGIEPLNIGNEGKVVIAVVKEKAEDVLSALRKTPEGKNATIVGTVRKSIKGVVMETVVGGKRIVEQPVGDPVPRIC